MCFDGGVLNGAEGERLTFDDVRFKDVSFAGGDFTGVEFVDVVFDTCDFSNASFQNATFHRCEINHSKLTGTDFANAKIGHTIMNECDGRYVNLSFSGMKEVTFAECNLTDGDFYECAFKAVQFTKCKMDSINFTERTWTASICQTALTSRLKCPFRKSLVASSRRSRQSGLPVYWGYQLKKNDGILNENQVEKSGQLC